MAHSAAVYPINRSSCGAGGCTVSSTQLSSRVPFTISIINKVLKDLNDLCDNISMKQAPTEANGKWSNFKAAWKACHGPQGRLIDPTLYSTEQLSRWLPLKFSSGVFSLLWLLVFFNLTLLLVAIESVLTEWYDTQEGIAVFFFECSYQLILLPWACVDLHKRRRNRLRPKRIIITAASGLFCLLLALAMWLWSSAFLWEYEFIWPHVSWGVLQAIDLSPILPIFAVFGIIL